jgi:hypothetical protein
MQFSRRFYRFAALASILSALTTLGLIFLPDLYPPVPDLDARMALGTNPAYVLRSWIYLVHPFLVFTAALAVAARCRGACGGAAALGLAGFALWAGTEAAQQAFTKVALDRTWRAAWPTADAAARELIRNHVAIYDVVWDSMYFLLLFGFLTGNLLLGWAVLKLRRVESGSTASRDSLGAWVTGVFWAAAALTFLLLVPELGGPATPGTDWLYPLLQPAGRALIGVWLWRVSSGFERANGLDRAHGVVPR